jgi:hypothetical protein
MASKPLAVITGASSGIAERLDRKSQKRGKRHHHMEQARHRHIRTISPQDGLWWRSPGPGHRVSTDGPRRFCGCSSHLLPRLSVRGAQRSKWNDVLSVDRSWD